MPGGEGVAIPALVRAALPHHLVPRCTLVGVVASWRPLRQCGCGGEGVQSCSIGGTACPSMVSQIFLWGLQSPVEFLTEVLSGRWNAFVPGPGASSPHTFPVLGRGVVGEGGGCSTSGPPACRVSGGRGGARRGGSPGRVAFGSPSAWACRGARAAGRLFGVARWGWTAGGQVLSSCASAGFRPAPSMLPGQHRRVRVLVLR